MATTTLSWAAYNGSLGGYWQDANHWALPSGSPAGVTPTTSTDVYILATGTAYSVTIGTATGLPGSASVASLIVDSPDATITFADNGAQSSVLTATSSILLNSGTIDVENRHTIRIGGTGTALAISGGALVENGGSIGVGGSGSNSNFLLSGGAAYLNGGTLHVYGAASFSSGTAQISNQLTAVSVTVASGEAVVLDGGSVTATQSGITNSGTISGFGTLSTGSTSTSDLEGGKVIASGSLGITAAGLAGALTAFEISANSTLAVSSGLGSGVTVTFDGTNSGGTAEALNLTNPSQSSFNVTDFASGDTIVIANAASYSMANGNQTMTVKDGGGATLATVNFDRAYNGTINLNNSTGTFTTTQPCFAAGSLIRTERGDVAVEQLQEGDRVVILRDGQPALAPITWIGHRRINLAAHPHPQTAAPVRIRRDAIDMNLPERDLVLSPDHCLFLDGKLIPAKLLINGMTIVQEMAPSVHYFHVEVEQHSVLLAEGLPVESYLDTGNRAYFLNSGTELILHPEFTVNAGLKAWETHACAPLTLDAATVAPIWQRLADRAGSLGFTAPAPQTTEDPDLHLLADGRTVRPLSVQQGRYEFALPAGAESVQLVSRAGMPSGLLAYVDDWRQIGVAVSRIVLRAQGTQMDIPADHPGLARGWHPVETDGATTWRWTDGMAELRLGGITGPAVLEVHVCNTARYVVAEERRLAA